MAERRQITEGLGPEPPDPTHDIRRLIQEQRRAEASLDDAQRRLRAAQDDHDRLGAIGRRIHRATHRDVDERITTFSAEIRRIENQIAEIGDRISAHAPRAAIQRSSRPAPCRASARPRCRCGRWRAVCWALDEAIEQAGPDERLRLRLEAAARIIVERFLPDLPDL